MSSPRPLTVLHLHSGNLYGGVETLLVTLARATDSDVPLRQDIALAFRGRLSDELLATGYAVEHYGAVRLRWPWTVHRARRWLAARFARNRPDACICHSAWARAVFGPVLRQAAMPVVAWVHGPVHPGHWLERRARGTPPIAVLANSEYIAENARAAGAVAPRVLYNPVAPPDREPDARRATRAAIGTDTATVAILHVARMEPWKGHGLLLDAVAELAADSRWELWFVGGAQRRVERGYQRGLERRARRLGIADRVRFLGERRDVRRLYAAADLYCQPNTGPEPFGITVVEALYAGIPVITSDAGGPAELVDETCGMRVPMHDVGALRDALRQLIGDSHLRARLGAGGPRRARDRCDPPTQVAALHRLLVEALA